MQTTNTLMVSAEVTGTATRPGVRSQHCPKTFRFHAWEDLAIAVRGMLVNRPAERDTS